LVLDLACGTGSLTSILSKRGYDMIGVDISEEMLAIARRKDPDILFLQQDMRKFELYGTVDAIICACDAINYLTENGDLEQVFKLAANYLNPGGLFIFDINTEYKFKEILADNTFAAADDTAAYIWENFYDDNDKINEYSITCFAKDGEVYNRFDELHMQRAYSVNEIKAALAAANLEFLAHYHEMTQEEPEAKAERVFFVAKSKK
jgi:SAM-dependent methyltransferase